MNIAYCTMDNAAFNQMHRLLTQVGFTCEHFSSDQVLIRTLRRRNFDLICFDVGVGLSENDSFFSWLNCRSGDKTPIVVISSSRSAEMAATALDSGADDFIARPFESVEVVARLHAILRRCGRTEVRRTIERAGFKLDKETRTFYDRGEPVELTPREFTMAWLFFSTPGVYISRESLSVAIWGVGSDITARTIEQHIYKLRKKLHLCPERGAILRTAYTQGYRLEITSEDSPSTSTNEPEIAFDDMASISTSV